MLQIGHDIFSKIVTLVLIGLPTSALAFCHSTEVHILESLGYSPTIRERICGREDIKNIVLENRSRAGVYYRGISVAPENFNRFHKGMDNEIWLSKELAKEPLEYSLRNHNFEGFSTIIKFEIPEIFVLGSLNIGLINLAPSVITAQKTAKLPKGKNDVDLFISDLGTLDQKAFYNSVVAPFENSSSVSNNYDYETMSGKANKEIKTFLNFAPYKRCDELLHSEEF